MLEFLDKVDPEAPKRARYRYACFEHFGEDPQAYGYSASSTRVNEFGASY
jgi:erythromycin esterase-like protein